MTTKKSRLVHVGIGLGAGFCLAVLACKGCQSRQLIVHGNSGIMSQEAKSGLESLKVGESTEREVVGILGQPSCQLFSNEGDTGLNYTCVATVMRTRYLFSPKAILTTGQDTYSYNCQVWFSPDGTLKRIDYQK